MDGHIVIVTGARNWPVELRRAVECALNTLQVLYGGFILFHGACQPRGSKEMTGADRYADDWALSCHADSIDLRRRPADWDRYDDRAGPIRNDEMVREAVAEAPVEHIHGLAFPDPSSRGTWNCVRRMEDFHIKVDVWDVPRARQWLVDEGRVR